VNKKMDSAMFEQHASALAELAADRKAPTLASKQEIESLGKQRIFADANYPYKTKMCRAEYETATQ
jgi:hypothetical protein